jgi:hypothetical protein
VESISSIAESILLGDAKELAETGRISSQCLPECELDISRVEVPSSFVGLALNEKVSEVVTKPVSTSVPKLDTNPDIKSLVEEFGTLVSRAKEILKEMTTCGTIGVNMAKPLKKDNEEEESPKVKKKRLLRKGRAYVK